MGRSEVGDFLEANRYSPNILPNSEPLASSAIITSKVIMHPDDKPVFLPTNT